METNVFFTNSQFYMIVIAGMITLMVGWLIFFISVMKTKESVKELIDGSFIQNLTVILIVVAVGYLAALKVLSSDLTGALLSGIVGYVLGSIKK
jgi:hypothetical protein